MFLHLHALIIDAASPAGWKDLSLGDVFQSEELSVALEMVRLRPTLEPMLPEGISWATARLLACDPSSKLTAEGMRHVVAEVIRDPDRFVLQLLGQLPIPQEWLLNHMKPQLECLLPAGACWQEIADCLRMILPDRDQSLVGHLHVVFSASWRLSSHTHTTQIWIFEEIHQELSPVTCNRPRQLDLKISWLYFVNIMKVFRKYPT